MAFHVRIPLCLSVCVLLHAFCVLSCSYCHECSLASPSRPALSSNFFVFLLVRDRWVELNCESKYVVNASNVPPEWHSWLHHIVESAPTEDPRPKPIFQLEHVPTDLSKMAFKANYVPPGYPVKPVDIKEDTKISTKRYKSWEPKL